MSCCEMHTMLSTNKVSHLLHKYLHTEDLARIYVASVLPVNCGAILLYGLTNSFVDYKLSSIQLYF